MLVVVLGNSANLCSVLEFRLTLAYIPTMSMLLLLDYSDVFCCCLSFIKSDVRISRSSGNLYFQPLVTGYSIAVLFLFNCPRATEFCDIAFLE